MYTLVDLFAGSGLVSLGLSRYFRTVWANDIDKIKATIYNNNIKENNIYLEDILHVSSEIVPAADLYWASFPCQDLSLAGNYDGLSGERSSLVNEFFRIVSCKDYFDRPNLIVLENVTGLITSNHGHDFIYIHSRLSELGYNTGAVVIDASYWVPQSRVRVFFIAVKREMYISRFITSNPTWAHPKSLVNLANKVDDFIFWNLPAPKLSRMTLSSIVDRNIKIDKKKSDHFMSLIPLKHLEILKRKLFEDENDVFAGYKRTRMGKQTLEVRFDGIGGCLRTASGGSSKQLLLYRMNDDICARYMTPREAARLMGAPEYFWLPESNNDAYTAMGDAVALPVTEYLAEVLLSRLLQEEKTYAFA